MSKLQKSLSAKPIFIMGIMHRSGTNFLSDLICLHPDCKTSQTAKEDFLISGSDKLIKYAEGVAKQWNQKWFNTQNTKPADLLLQNIGNGLIDFLSTPFDPDTDSRIDDTRLVTKTPDVTNIKNFFKLFPKAYLLIIIRDGRSIVESGVKSFNWKYDQATHRWAKAAKQVLTFQKALKKTPFKFKIVKFEDILSNQNMQLEEILSFLDLDPQKYDFDTASKMPVKGSSELSEKENVHWKPEEKNTDFDPTKRYDNWDRKKHQRFNWVAGKYLDKFDYPRVTYPGSKIAATAKNILMDIKWIAIKTIKLPFKK